MSAAREQLSHRLLVDALANPVGLNAVDWHVRHQNPSATPSEMQSETLELIRYLVTEELFQLGHEVAGRQHPGSVGKAGHRFVAWHHPLEHSIRHIFHYYIRHYDDPEYWMYSAYLQLTAKGGDLARSLEQQGVDSYRNSG